MLTRRHATDLLTRFADGQPPHAILSFLGFGETPLPLDTSIGLLEGLPLARAEVATPSVAGRGGGARRALLVAVAPHVSVRATVTSLAQRLHRDAPHHDWLLLVSAGSSGALASWRSDGAKARVSALVFQGERVLESDAEVLMALHAASSGDDVVVRERWCEILGREALSHRFYRALEHHVLALGEGARGSAPSEARRELALITTSRLLFLAFLQSRGWLDTDADFLARHLDRVLASGGDAHRRFLEPLAFGTLNTRVSQRAAAARAFGRVPFLNGGLFARSPVECRHRRVRFRDEDLGALFDELLARYRFTGREQQRDWTESAVDPEILGRAFESLMASRERRDSGAFYTPHALVARVTDAALEDVLGASGVVRDPSLALRNPAALPPDERTAMHGALLSLRLLDPACGSGAFLVHALERVAHLTSALGDERSPSALRRAMLTSSIFGVDLNPMAVWLCELRLWLSVVMDLDVTDPLDVPPLPNLDRNVRVGDTLAGGDFGASRSGRRDGGCTSAPAGARDGAHEGARASAPEVRATAILRARYARATGPRKLSLARALDREERRAARAELDDRLRAATEARRALVHAARGRDLFGNRRGAVGDERHALAELRQRVRAIRQAQRALARGGALPFRFASHFADVAAAGGFDMVLGNPPWVRLHRIPAENREAFRRDFSVFRNAAWQAGAAAAGAGAGFAAQVDLAALFTERSMALLRPRGTLALLLPLKLWRSLAGGGVRRLLGAEHELQLLEDWSEAPASFDAAAYPSLVVARHRGRVQLAAGRSDGEPPVAPAVATAASRARGPAPRGDAPPPVRLGVHRRDFAIGWSCSWRDVPLDDTPGAPWLILPPPARAAFARLAAAGPSLAESGLGRPILGVKCGCNDAFLVDSVANGLVHAVVRGAGREGTLEASLLRPVLRGEQARSWSPRATTERIIWTHDAAGRPLATLPPHAARWLGRWRGDLSRRTDLRGSRAWWSLHRIEAAASSRPRVVWADMSRGPRACILPAHSPVVPLNSCYVATCRDDTDAAALAALLNSPLAGAWLDALAEPARGGFRRYLGWTVARLPIPADWGRARDLLAPLGQRGVAGEALGSDELLAAVVAAYRVRPALARALVEWTWR
ncbi:MAG: type IIL restriction-modification enzyme MmeI [Gemmatimonadaceae bacterium]